MIPIQVQDQCFSPEKVSNLEIEPVTEIATTKTNIGYHSKHEI